MPPMGQSVSSPALNRPQWGGGLAKGDMSEGRVGGLGGGMPARNLGPDVSGHQPFQPGPMGPMGGMGGMGLFNGGGGGEMKEPVSLDIAAKGPVWQVPQQLKLGAAPDFSGPSPMAGWGGDMGGGPEAHSLGDLDKPRGLMPLGKPGFQPGVLMGSPGGLRDTSVSILERLPVPTPKRGFEPATVGALTGTIPGGMGGVMGGVGGLGGGMGGVGGRIPSPHHALKSGLNPLGPAGGLRGSLPGGLPSGLSGGLGGGPGGLLRPKGMMAVSQSLDSAEMGHSLSRTRRGGAPSAIASLPESPRARPAFRPQPMGGLAM
jgi:hypothetical protein